MDKDELSRRIESGNYKSVNVDRIEDSDMKILVVLLGHRESFVRAGAENILRELEKEKQDERAVAFIEVFVEHKKEKIPKLSKYVGDVRYVFLESKNAEMRQIALQVLTVLEKRESLYPIFAKAIRDSSPEVRLEAVGVLYESLGKKERIILREALGDNSSMVAIAAAEALASSANSMDDTEKNHILEKFRQTKKLGYAMALTMLSQRGVDEIILMLGDSRKEARDTAAMALKQSSDPIVTAFVSTFASLRILNIELLKKRLSLVEQLAKSPYQQVRLKALDVLKQVGSKRALMVFSDSLPNWHDPETRDFVIRALAEIGDEKSIQPLRSLALRNKIHGTNGKLNEQIEIAISAIKKRCGIEEQYRSVAGEIDISAQAQKEVAIGGGSKVKGGLGDAVAEFSARREQGIPEKEAEPVKIEKPPETKPKEEPKAAEKKPEVKKEEPKKEEKPKEEKKPEKPKEVVKLKETEKPRKVSDDYKHVSRALKSGSYEKRCAALVLLGGMPPSERTELLLDALSSRFGGEDAAKALGERKDEVSDGQFQRLLRLLEKGNNSERKNSALALGEIGDERALEPLLGRLKSEIEEVRAAITKAIGKFADPKSVDGIIDSLCDESVKVSNIAATSLSNVKDAITEEQMRRIANFIEIGDEEIAKTCAVVLSMVGDKARPYLMEATRSSHTSVKRIALERVGFVGDKTEVQKRMKSALMYDVDSSVRRAATRELGKHGGFQHVELLIRTLGDPDDGVSSDAATALRVMKSPTGKIFTDFLNHEKGSLKKIARYGWLLKALAESRNERISERAGKILQDIRVDPEAYRKYNVIMRKYAVKKVARKISDAILKRKKGKVS